MTIEDSELTSDSEPVVEKVKKVKKRVKEEEPQYTVCILKLIKELQQQHGLRHSDYQRYRGYCSRRLHRIRKALGLPNSDRHNFKKKTRIEEHRINEKTITIPLMLAERAWSFAMQLRLEANTEPRKKFHLVSRLHKATKYAILLQELCDSPKFDGRTKLEAEGYVAWMQGTLHFELKLWELAIEHFKKAQVIYERLAMALDEEEATLYRERCDEITPGLRYCAYNLGEASAAELLQLRSQTHSDFVHNLDVLIAQTAKRNEEIRWRGRPITVKSEKVRAFLLADCDLEKSFDSVLNNLTLLEQHLMDCKDAIAAAKEDSKGEKDGGQSLLNYLAYIRLNRTVQRNLSLIEAAKKDAAGGWSDAERKKLKSGSVKLTKVHDTSRLYEIIVQNLMEMEQLPVADDTYVPEIRDRIKAYQALRCLAMGETLAGTGHYGAAVKLYDRAAELSNTVLASKYLAPELKEELRSSIAETESSKIVLRAKSVLEEISATKKVESALVDRLYEYYEDQSLLTTQPKIAKLPPPMVPTPCKPLFFDLALDMVQFPELDKKISECKASKAAGIKGFVKGLWGWNNPK